MPIYQYKCQECGLIHEYILQHVNDNDLTCPDCSSTNLELQISIPVILKTGNSYAETTCCGKNERCEVPPCSINDVCRRK